MKGFPLSSPTLLTYWSPGGTSRMKPMIGSEILIPVRCEDNSGNVFSFRLEDEEGRYVISREKTKDRLPEFYVWVSALENLFEDKIMKEARQKVFFLEEAELEKILLLKNDSRYGSW